jgi:hypothetical protein
MGYQGAIGLWTRYSGDPAIERIDTNLVRDFRNKLIETPFRWGHCKRKRSVATVNKIMRELHVVLNPLWPADRYNTGGKGLIPFFKWPKALKKQLRLPFVYSDANLDAIYWNCDACKQTTGCRTTALNLARFWRLALVLALNTGARTWDLFGLQWEAVRLTDDEPYRFGSIVFQAQKTGKLHRIPLNECSQRHLQLAFGRRHEFLDRGSIFPGFYKGKSFYRTWNRIVSAAKVSGLDGGLPKFESMRKTAVTRHNSVIWNAGFWISGHVDAGVFGAYDNPSDRIFEAVYSCRLPASYLAGMELMSQGA